MNLRVLLIGCVIGLGACSGGSDNDPTPTDSSPTSGSPAPGSPAPGSPAPPSSPQPAPAPGSPEPNPNPEPPMDPPALGPQDPPPSEPSQPTFPGTFINGASIESLQSLWVCTEPDVADPFGLGFAGDGQMTLITTDSVGTLNWRQDGNDLVLTSDNGAAETRLTGVSFPDNDRLMFGAGQPGGGLPNAGSDGPVSCILQSVGSEGPAALIQPSQPMPEPTPEPAPEPTPEPAPEPTPAPAPGSSPFANSVDAEGVSIEGWGCGFDNQFEWTMVLAPNGVGVLVRSGASELTDLTWTSNDNTQLTLALSNGSISLTGITFNGTSNFTASSVNDNGTELSNVGCRVLPL